mmetsp:Transcript_47472/g.125908  ORF Transcript_47472/g.125908 Transcript_47472/m.125908 type:complete len:84 (-) Transcript_47472:179-430(-)
MGHTLARVLHAMVGGHGGQNLQFLLSSSIYKVATDYLLLDSLLPFSSGVHAVSLYASMVLVLMERASQICGSFVQVFSSPPRR